MNRKQRYLARRYLQQDGLCIWCGCWCYLPGVHTREFVYRKLGQKPGAPGSFKAVNHKMATAEHLIPLSHGGANRLYNIVMACKLCNNRRGSDRAAFEPDARVLALLPQRDQNKVIKSTRVSA